MAFVRGSGPHMMVISSCQLLATWWAFSVSESVHAVCNMLVSSLMYIRTCISSSKCNFINVGSGVHSENCSTGYILQFLQCVGISFADTTINNIPIVEDEYNQCFMLQEKYFSI